MNLVPAFWDTRPLVALCIRQPTTSSVERLAARFQQVLWWSAPAEAHSAIARLNRAGLMSEASKELAISALVTLKESWVEIIPTTELRDLASDLLYLYPLRAADSLQLAAAMIWRRRKPAGRTFITSDTRLGEAAAQAGFKVLIPDPAKP